MFDHNPPPNRVRRSWRHKRLAASISAEIEAQVGGAALDLSVALNASLPDPTDSTTTESETTTTSESQTPTETTTTTTTTTTSTETTTTTTTSTSFSTTTSTSLSTSISTSISTSSRTRTFTHDQTSSLTQTSTLSTTRFTTSTTFTTSTSLTTSTSQTLYTHTTLFTSSPSSSLITADTSSSSISINIPATTGVLGSGENNDKGFAHSTGAIVGVSAGILVFVLLVGILLFFGVKRYRRKYKSSSGFPSPVRPPIDGEEEHELHPSPIDQSSPVDQDQARFSPPLVATTSLGHGSSSGEDGDVPHVIAPGSVDIHGASTESGGTLYPHSSQGHSTSSGDHLLGGGSPTSPSGYAPFALSPSSPRPPSAWRDPPTSPTASSSGHGHSSLLPTIPMPVPATQRPASSKSGKRRSLLDRVFGNTSKRSPSPSSVASDTPRASMSSPMTELPFGDSAPWRRPPPSFLGPDPTTAEPGTLSLLPPSLRERNLSAPEGLLHPKRPDLFTQESSRTLMDHVDYSRPILPESHAHKTSITDTTASDTKSTKVMTPDTEGLNPMDAVP